MIGYLKGKVLSISLESAIIVVNCVGYEVYCTGSAFANMREGAECEVYTYMQVSEQNGVMLYGFSSVSEKAMFLNLISVSGVGPKMALSVLTYMNVNDVATAVVTNDIKGLSKVKGLGKKTAERIILELREKVSLPQASASPSKPIAPVGVDDEDAIVALMSLGFKRTESEKAVAKAKANGANSVEDIVLNALRSM